MKSIITLSCCVFSGVLLVSAQSTENSSGANASGSSGNVSYSIGQIFYEPVSSSSGSVSPGVQQSYEITETLGSDITEINLSLKIHPNPTPDILYLKVGFTDYKRYRYELYDSSGKVLQSRPVQDSQVSIAMASYPSAVYYLKISKEGKVVKIFKVLKTDK